MSDLSGGQFSIGVDVGGTFTDVVLSHPRGIWKTKTPSTRGDIGRGVIAGVELAAAQAGVSISHLLANVEWFGLGTTAVTNVVAEIAGARVGLITTVGFENEMHLACGIRFSIDGRVRGPDPIISPSAIAGVRERVDHSGKVLRPLDPEEAAQKAGDLIARESVQALAVSFLNAYRNPRHEEQAVAAIRERFPDVPVASATALNPGFGFLQRTMYAVLNAFAGTAFAGVDELVAELGRLGLRTPLRLVNSTGGTIGVEGARSVPMLLMQSGPAAGVAAAASIAGRMSLERVIACDMGGTSFDVSVVSAGQPQRRSNAEILQVPTGLSMVDVDSIGAGGGSIGWVDSRGMLRVGPRSAGSVPGPACYGWGGSEPTVTDALVVLGYVDPERFLGGRMRLDATLAREACAGLGTRIGLSAKATAWGIRQIALADMTRATQRIMNHRGLDAREFSIISYGGCGSLFNVDIALALGIKQVIVPNYASVLSAFGAATAPVRRERATAIVSLFPIDLGSFMESLNALRASVLDDLRGDLIPEPERSVTFEAALRFRRQLSELPIALRLDLPSEEMIVALQEDFRTEYVRRYGEGSIVLGAAIELVTLRAIGTGKANSVWKAVARFELRPPIASGPTRRVWLEAESEGTPVSSIASDIVQPGVQIVGPACVDGVDTTTWIPPGSTAVVDGDYSLLINVATASASVGKNLKVA